MVNIWSWFWTTLAAAPILQHGVKPAKGSNPSDFKQGQRLVLPDLHPEILEHIVYRLPLSDMNSVEGTARKLKNLITGERTRRLNKLFLNLSRRMDLPTMKEVPIEQIGLRILLDGAQLEFRAMTHTFLKYLKSKNPLSEIQPSFYELRFPDRFQRYASQELDIPKIVEPWINVNYGTMYLSPARVKHSLANLGLNCDMDYLFDVVEALFYVLNSLKLMDNFRAVADQIAQEQQEIHSVDSSDPATASQVRPQDFRVFMNQFWLEFIGRGGVKQLRYYFFNFLVYDVIPRILGQVLESPNSSKAMNLADRISKIPYFTRFVKTYSTNAPNYFEFIVIYTTIRKLDGLPIFLPAAQSIGKVDVQLVYNCFMYARPNSPWSSWDNISSLQPPLDIAAWPEQDQTLCTPLLAKYTRNFLFENSPTLLAFFPPGEDTSDFILPKA